MKKQYYIRQDKFVEFYEKYYDYILPIRKYLNNTSGNFIVEYGVNCVCNDMIYFTIDMDKKDLAIIILKYGLLSKCNKCPGYEDIGTLYVKNEGFYIVDHTGNMSGPLAIKMEPTYRITNSNSTRHIR